MSKWISVKDRLPKMTEKVLTYSNNSIMPIKINFINNYQNKWTYDCSHNLTHWMPLPEPPEE